MTKSELFQQIAKKESDKEKIVLKVTKNPELLSQIIAGLGADKVSIKYGCAKVLRATSEVAPELLYPSFDFFAEFLDSANTVLKWEAIYVIGNLAAVDTENRIEGIFDKYFAPITGPVMITAANVIGGAAKIALAEPELAERIAKEILKVEKANYQTTECRNVALGHAIRAFDQFFDQIEDKGPVIELVKKTAQHHKKRDQEEGRSVLEETIRLDSSVPCDKRCLS